MNIRLQPGTNKPLTIIASEKYSTDKVEVKRGERYHITADSKQRWTDWFIRTTPDGFFNILASLAGLRVKGVKCFSLCGAINEDDTTAFAIGSDKVFSIDKDGLLSFFANDAAKHYGNNKGSIEINIKRVE